MIPPKVEYYSRIMGVKPSSVKITSAHSRFGSCSGKNAICFSYILMCYPEEAIDYVVVHELAHIKHHNHSRSFYNFIGKFMPDYKQREKLLKPDLY
ncbi:MAG: M48 family metallopeptidase [Clostridia bacterium]|nr:M48 family metallopeptidase [Clostridia bacterium]